MGNAFVHDGIYGVNNLIVCELREHRLYIPYYTDEADEKLKWFPMGIEATEEFINENRMKNIKLTCRYVAEKIICKNKNYYSPDDHVFFTRNSIREYIMELDKIPFTKIPFKYPNKKYKKYYITKDVVNESIMSKVKHHCFTLSMCVSQRTIDYDAYDAKNLFQLIDKDATHV